MSQSLCLRFCRPTSVVAGVPSQSFCILVLLAQFTPSQLLLILTRVPSKMPTRLSQLERKSRQPKVTNPFILCRTRCNKNEHFVKTFIAISNKACNLMNPCHEKKSRTKFSLSFVFPEKYFSLCFFVFPVSRGHERNLLHHSQLLERVNFKMMNQDCCVVLPSCLS